MSCNHEVQHLVGTSEGITCRLCGKQFKTFDELVKDRPAKSEKPVKEKAEPKAVAEEVAEEKPKAEAEEKPKRGRKAAK